MHIIEVFTTGNKCYQVGAPLPQFLVRAIAALRADVSQRGGGDGDA